MASCFTSRLDIGKIVKTIVDDILTHPRMCACITYGCYKILKIRKQYRQVAYLLFMNIYQNIIDYFISHIDYFH